MGNVTFFTCKLFAISAILALLASRSSAIDVTSKADGGAVQEAQNLADLITADMDPLTVVPFSAHTTINGGANPSSDEDAYGTFSNGITPVGTLLPAANQNAAGDAAYAGGIGIDAGICLCTGVIEDEPNALSTGRASGVLGPNNGIDNVGGFNPGEIVTELGTPIDQDFASATGLPGGGDATVLEFDIELIEEPGYVRISFVFGSDENPFFIDQFSVNDSIAILIDGENVATITKNGMTFPFSLFEFEECGLPLFIENDVAPSPPALVGSGHAIPSAPLYDIEFGGFTKVLTREISCPLAPGSYTVKIVVQDVADRFVDAALFIPNQSVKVYTFLNADFDLDGDIDADDFSILSSNMDQCGAKFTDGDADGDGCVTEADFDILDEYFGATGGNADYRADFNRDGYVDGADFLIRGRHNGLDHCASRFEGDADEDGDVDGFDLDIWQAEAGGNFIQSNADCVAGGQGLAGGGQGFAASGSTNPELDLDQDGDVDHDDVKLYGLRFE